MYPYPLENETNDVTLQYKNPFWLLPIPEILCLGPFIEAFHPLCEFLLEGGNKHTGDTL